MRNDLTPAVRGSYEQATQFVSPRIKHLRQMLFGKYVVALDSNILDKLEKDSAPDWFAQFQEMSAAGVKFVIPDLCVGERIECFANANPAHVPSMKSKWKRMVSRLDAIIWKEFPCLPLRGDLFALVGIRERECAISHQMPFTLREAKKLYRLLHDYEDSQFNSPGYRIPFEQEIEKERREWEKLIARFRELLQNVDEQNHMVSRMLPKEKLLEIILLAQTRDFYFRGNDTSLIELPFRFLIERVYNQKYCNPHLGRRSKNDGLDFLLLFLTMASINVCSTDRFFRQARKLGLPRSRCCHTPEMLSKKWHDLPRVDVLE